MSVRTGTRFLSMLAVGLALTGCQGIIPDETDDSVGAARLAQARPVASSQRFDEDGYPLLGAFPGKAAPQLSDDAVQQTGSQFTSIASQRAGTPASSPADDTIERANRARERQAEILRQAQASQPAASGTTRRGPRPEDVLREIEAADQPTN